MSDKIPNLDLIPNSLGHMILDEEQIVQVTVFKMLGELFGSSIFRNILEFW